MRVGQELPGGRAQMGSGREERAQPPHMRAPGWADGASPPREARGCVCVIPQGPGPRGASCKFTGSV